MRENRRDESIAPKRTRRKRSYENKKRFPIKPSKLLPMAFLICAVAVGAVLSKDYTAETAQESVGNAKPINYFVLPEDDYSFYYVPLVINGIEEYKKGEAVSDEMVAACCWSLLSDSSSKEKYEFFDEKTVIPEDDVTKRASKLFGTGLKLEHRSVNINGCRFEYEEHNYNIEITGMTPTFLPKLLKLESEYGKVTLIVGCLKNDEYVQDKDGNTVEPKPTKRLKFILTDDGDGLYVKSVEVVK